MKIAFLCKGSRGDIEPLLAVILTLHKYHPTVEVVLVCCSTAINGLECALTREKDWIQIHYFPESLQDKLLNAEVNCCMKACSDGIGGVVFNLFSLEGYMIANHLNVPSVAISPFLLSRVPPKNFSKSFAKEHPFLFSTLSANSRDRSLLSYKDVEHWMWRLFLNDLSAACDSIGICPFPIPYPTTASPLQWSLPPPTPLIFGLSPSLVPREQYWPESVELCGFWKLPASWLPVKHLDDHVQSFIDSHRGRLVYTGFGSMERYMTDTDWTKLMGIFDEVFMSLGLFSIVQCQCDGPLIQSMSNGDTYPSLMIYPTEYTCHSRLFPLCDVAIIHHGGAGTMSSAILAGVPQIIWPVMFDQYHWGHVVEWKGLGRFINTRPSTTTPTTKYQLKSSLLAVMNDDIKKNIRQMKELIETENGEIAAVKILEQTMKLH